MKVNELVEGKIEGKIQKASQWIDAVIGACIDVFGQPTERGKKFKGHVCNIRYVHGGERLNFSGVFDFDDRIYTFVPERNLTVTYSRDVDAAEMFASLHDDSEVSDELEKRARPDTILWAKFISKIDELHEKFKPLGLDGVYVKSPSEELTFRKIDGTISKELRLPPLVRYISHVQVTFLWELTDLK